MVSISSAPQTPGPVGERNEILRNILRFSRLEFLAYSLTSVLSITVINDLSQAYRDSSVRQYQSCWKTFQCSLHEERIQEISQVVVLRFLCHFFHDKNRTLATIQTHEAALKAPLFYGCNLTLDTVVGMVTPQLLPTTTYMPSTSTILVPFKSTGFLNSSSVPSFAIKGPTLLEGVIFNGFSIWHEGFPVA
ncbi:hypothetical protein Pcinc_003722 [Petrolisthes cinctipes]|uniref:Uncharacterized protein n=1 Tax=Petrolisthes cinctipes TaxID=88211 RepID=A0AAE1L0Z1_PETCI|nr:hypothetical protein Pcinc_003722 [Petrolisthes cinctipes]